MADGGTRAPTLLRVMDVSAGYGKLRTLSNVSIDVQRGKVTALVGPNGCGKTTLLRVLLGLLNPQAGSVEWPQGRVRVGYVPQADASEQIFPVSALEVVCMGLTPGMALLRSPGSRERADCQEAMERFDVARLAGHPCRVLSGGQRQRVMLARATVANPELLVLDEPVRGLDFASSAKLVSSMRDLALNGGMAVVVATHSLDLVANYADTVALFKEGRVLAGPVAEILDDAHLTDYLGTPIHVAEVDGIRMVVPGEMVTRSVDEQRP